MFLYFQNDWNDTYTGTFWLVRIKKAKRNNVAIRNGSIKKSIFQVTGNGNTIVANDALIEDTQVVINGLNNTLYISKDVKLRKANIIIRGSNCHVEIGKGTTFGGVRIINVGVDNKINIGENCLFSDHIEIWASDTHSIYNEYNEKINKEKPIKIGDNVWVGSHVIVLKGTEINDGAIIGMGTIVSKNIPKSTISVGVPNRVINENVHWTNEY
ncbi:MAG: acyltransferase [Cellulophaga sp.]|nr:acyltransferase [Cellulophaga sp.]